jgi:hypothetical protein
VTLDDPALIMTAVDRVERGMDFADALHLGPAAVCDGFVTFDQRLIKTAKATGVPNVAVP